MIKSVVGLRRPAQIAFVLSLMLFGMVQVGTASASPAVLTTFEFSLGNDCIAGVGPANTELRVVLRSASGEVQGHFRASTDPTDGTWGYRCFWGTIDSGDVLTATDGTTTRTLTVPPLAFAINRATDVIAGSGPQSSPLRIGIDDCHSEWDGCDR